MFPILRAGMRAYYDAFGALVPVWIEAITPRDDAAAREIRPSSEHTVIARVLENVGGWKRGERIEAWSLRMVPCAAVRHMTYSTRIGFYTVECDTEGSN